MPSKDDNRIRIRPFIMERLREEGFVTTEAVAELANSILFMWMQGLLPMPTTVQVAPRINLKRDDDCDTPSGDLSEAETALDTLFDDWEDA